MHNTLLLEVSATLSGMAFNEHPDDQPPGEWRRFVSDDEARTAVPAFSFQDPVAVGLAFCNALDRRGDYLAALQRMVTPESLPAWGDFREAAAFHSSIENPGYGSVANRAHGDDEVAYFKILADITRGYQAQSDQIVGFAGIVTLVWRRELGEWRVHAFGGDYLRPEEVPH